MHNHVMHTKEGVANEEVSNLQFSAYNDDLWFGFNMKRNLRPVDFEKVKDA
jgi:hypothetical protein